MIFKLYSGLSSETSALFSSFKFSTKKDVGDTKYLEYFGMKIDNFQLKFICIAAVTIWGGSAPWTMTRTRKLSHKSLFTVDKQVKSWFKTQRLGRKR